MIRVLFVEPGRGYGGAQTILLALLATLDRTSFEPIVACAAGEHFEAKCRELSLKICPLPIRSLLHPGTVIRSFGRLAKICQQSSPNVILSNDFGGHFYAGPIASYYGIPVMWWLHGVAVPQPSRTWFIQRATAKIPALRRVTNSLWTRQKLQERLDLLTDVIYIGIDTARFSQAKGDAVRREFGIRDEQLVFTSAGRLVEFKGHHIFLQAAARAFKGQDNIKLMIVGGSSESIDPQYPQFLRDLAEDLGISRQLIVTGFRDDMPAVYAASDVCVHANTLHEGFGLTIVEAMSLSKPVIATKTGGPEEIVLDGDTGFLVSPGNVQEMAERMRALTADKALRHRMGEAGAARVMEHFTLPRMTTEIQSVLSNVVQSRR